MTAFAKTTCIPSITATLKIAGEKYGPLYQFGRGQYVWNTYDESARALRVSNPKGFHQAQRARRTAVIAEAAEYMARTAGLSDEQDQITGMSVVQEYGEIAEREAEYGNLARDILAKIHEQIAAELA